MWEPLPSASASPKPSVPSILTRSSPLRVEENSSVGWISILSAIAGIPQPKKQKPGVRRLLFVPCQATDGFLWGCGSQAEKPWWVLDTKVDERYRWNHSSSETDRRQESEQRYLRSNITSERMPRPLTASLRQALLSSVTVHAVL